ncbi:MAG: ATP-dependent Clp protease ATP-binding subunit ClpX [Lachnospiraceae bacterium]|nr:ATP-dependent Clp protease ATP-binding subunit ClpX [Lachnospiraceae bacterium]
MSKEYNDDEYEKICYLCRRQESKAGKMITLPGNIHVCADCMQNTMNSLISSGMMDGDIDEMQDMMNAMSIFPGMGVAVSNENKKTAKKSDASEAAEAENGEVIESDESEDRENEEEREKKSKRTANISFINLGEMMGDFQRRPKIKKKSNRKPDEPLIDLKKIPAPHKIKEQLDEYVIGQDYAKKVMSVAVYNHYKRVATNTMNDIEIEKSNMLMIGPTGCGKTYIVRTLAKLLDVPLAIADATSLTEAGYIGDDIESVLSKLLAAADNDVEKAETGIVFIDEIDKIAKKQNTNSRDVSGEAVQQGLLKLLEGSEIEVPVGSNSKNAMVPLATINTKNILFICGGAFPNLTDIIKERLNKQSAIGFQADLKDKYDNDKDLLKKVTVEDIKNFGMIPEFIGRLPVLFTLDGLSSEMLQQVLKEPKNAILKQYQKLLELDEVQLEFEDEAIAAIAEKAIEKKTGARALRAIIEDFMLDIMYEIPKDDSIGKVIITRDYIDNNGSPKIIMRGTEYVETN